MSKNDSCEIEETARASTKAECRSSLTISSRKPRCMALVMGLVIFLATLMPAPMGEPADPLKTPAGIKPEWYFLSVYQILKYVPKNVGIIITFMIFPPILMLFPLFYKQITAWRYGRLTLHTIVALGVLFAVFLSLLAYLGFE